MKKRILHVGEWTGHSSGYSTYACEILQRLHATGKYEIAELGCYYDGEKPSKVPWKVYPNIPRDPELLKMFGADQAHQYGQFSLPDVCLDFGPHIIFTIRDWWHDEFIERSPYRKFFRWAHMATVDAEPQPEKWISTYVSADALLAYSDWGLRVLKETTGNSPNIAGTASPGADFSTFKPLNKKACRRALGLNENDLIVGTTMRNAPRKRFPELIQAFKRFLEIAPSQDVESRAKLYLHTSYPDQGWDIPKLIRDSGISNRILVSYLCKDCGRVLAGTYRDAVAICKHCGGKCHLPNTARAANRELLAAVLNCLDAYVQYANSEGFGIPMVEAAACGVPIFATDYSAMSDVIRKLGGHPIKIKALVKEAESGCDRATPDNEDLAKALSRHFGLPDRLKLEKSRRSCEAAQLHYTWDQAVATWMNIFDAMPPASPWSSPACFHSPRFPDNDFETNEQLVRWCFKYTLGRPDLAYSHIAQRMIRDLDWGETDRGYVSYLFSDQSLPGSRPLFRPYGRDQLIAELLKMHKEAELAERLRVSR